MENKIETTIVYIYIYVDDIGNNGKENGNYYSIYIYIYKDNIGNKGKANGNYHSMYIYI